MYDYWLGGKDNFAADRAMAEASLERIPTLRDMARANRAFVARATDHIARSGVRQFLDVGTGIPTSPNLHETAQAIAPDAKVVYVDNDPVVLAHARALMVSSDEGATAYVDADLRDPEKIFNNPHVLRVLDLDQPVGLMVIAVLMLIADAEDPWSMLASLRDVLPSGSYLALTHPTGDFDPAAMADLAQLATRGRVTFSPRKRDDVQRFFGDWELVDPGLVPVMAWRPQGDIGNPQAAYYWAGVARKP
jgi:SAM-dependent methyltransferase